MMDNCTNLGYLLTLSAKLMKYHLMKQLDQENFTVQQWAVIKDLERLEGLGGAENNFMAVSIANRLDMDKPTISGIIKRLLEKGYIEKYPHSTDKRASILKLSAQTKEILPRLEELSDQTVSAAVVDFTEEEISQLTHLLFRMTKNLKEEE
ncbi:MarR family winged helix-turn-helix transcriptional regulator [Robertmurraya korlensis]|uniref:MarR family winged helix-turn-helix transcriptional regulator n=1 Tax=Robertmurraya korlensis TaxID=519977 RepID=UPI00082658AD|nr:MarR family transcriptional regulator [Robertmurraya korlensis]